MQVRLVPTQTKETAESLRWLQLQTLPGDAVVDPEQGHWWLARDGSAPIAFICIQSVESWPEAGYVARCGVLAKYRGKRLQQHMLRVIERRARAMGLTHLVSTTYQNPPSANSFIACGYKTYEPQKRWGADDTIYWIKELSP